MEKIVIRNYINGKWGEREERYVSLYNPSTGEVIGEVPISGRETTEAAITSAAEAYISWREVPIAKRMTYIYKIHACMVRDLEKLACSIALDQAKHIFEARGEVQRVIEIVEAAASTPSLMQGDILDQIAPNIYAKVVKQSLGVFGGVAPFNFPALVFGWFIPYAIAAGNTFIYKPSTQSPYFMQLMCEIFTEIELPAGVVNVIYGNREIPGAWYEDPRIAGVCLVGSTSTAKKMAEGCARGAKRSMLLGGAKNMLVVMEDADIDVFIENYLNSCYIACLRPTSIKYPLMVSISPIISPPRRAPGMLPIPPRTTTTKDMMPKFMPTVGKTGKIGASKAPAIPTMQEPTAKVSQKILFISMPISCAAFRSCTVALMALPICVYARKRKRKADTIMATMKAINSAMLTSISPMETVFDTIGSWIMRKSADQRIRAILVSNTLIPTVAKI